MDLYVLLLCLPFVLTLSGVTIAAVVNPDRLGPVLALLDGWANLNSSFRRHR
jgi:hypothetical protein